MTWWQFRYAFSRDVENAMRYSIHEAMRDECQRAGGGTSQGIANNAVERFKQKMEKYAPTKANAARGNRTRD